MEPSTSQSLLERATDLDAREALAMAAEALRLTPEDHRARAVVGRMIARRGRVHEGAVALTVAGELVLARGYPVAAIAYAKESLAIDPNHDARELLGKIHTRIAGHSVARRLPVPPPVLPQPIEAGSPDAITLALDDATLLERATALAVARVPAGVEEVDLSGVPLFSEITHAGFVPLVQALVHAKFDEGAEIVTQGELGTSMFLVVSGEVEVLRELDGERKALARLGPGALVGEMALITEQPRSASVIARGHVELFVIDRSHVERAAAAHPAITQELVDFARRRLLRNLLESSPLFQPLSGEERLEVLRAFNATVVAPGTAIITRGRPSTGLFLIATGEVRVTTVDDDGDEVELARLSDGEVLGEIGLLDGGLTTATAVAARKTVVLHLPRERFATLAGAHPEIAGYLMAVSAARKAASAKAVASTTEVLDADDLVVI